MKRLWLLCAASAVLAGCTGDVMYLATFTKLGISATGTGEQVTEATLGYDRFEGTFIPVRNEETGALLEEAPSVMTCFAFRNSFFGELVLNQAFATGAAAEAFAAKEDPCKDEREQAGTAQTGADHD